MRCVYVGGPAHGEELDLVEATLSFVIVNRAGGNSPGGYQRHRYEPGALTPELAQRGFAMGLHYVGIEPESTTQFA